MHIFESNLITINEEIDRAFDIIGKEVRAIQDATEDFLVPVETVEVIDRDNICILADDELASLEYSDTGLSELCEMVNVPYEYMRRLLESEKPNDEKIFKANVNNGIANRINKITEARKLGKKPADSMLVRTYNGIIRAVLSTQYSAYDQDNILKLLELAFADRNLIRKEDFMVNIYMTSPENFHIKLLNKDVKHIGGRRIQCGMEINSSDVGLSMLTVNFCIYDVATGSVLTFHVNNHKADAKRSFMQQVHKNITRSKIEDKLATAFESFDGVTQKVAETIEEASRHQISLDKIFEDDKSPLKRIFAKEIGLSVTELNKLKEQLMQQKDLFSFACRIAEYAQSKPAYDRIRLEHIAGDIINKNVGIKLL